MQFLRKFFEISEGRTVKIAENIAGLRLNNLKPGHNSEIFY